jgi:carbonic anhydrase
MCDIKLRLMWVALVAASIAHAGEKPPWGYAGEHGPEHWGALDPTFVLCATGANQSPIDLETFVDVGGNNALWPMSVKSY